MAVITSLTQQQSSDLCHFKRAFSTIWYSEDRILYCMGKLSA